MKKNLLICVALITILSQIACAAPETAPPPIEDSEPTTVENIRYFEERIVEEPTVKEQFVEEQTAEAERTEQPHVEAHIYRPFLIFSSLEEFLDAHRALRDGTASAAFTSIANQLDFLSIERLYLPSGIPETYVLSQISVGDVSIALRFLSEEHMVSEEVMNRALMLGSFLQFRFNRGRSPEAAMEGFLSQNRIAEEDLIDGRYYFDQRRNQIQWVSGASRMTIDIPEGSIPAFAPFGERGGITEEDIVSYAAVESINLFDDIAVNELLMELRAED